MYLDDYFFYDPALLDGTPAIMEIGVFTCHKVLTLHEAYPHIRACLVEPDPGNWETLFRAISLLPPIVRACVDPYRYALMPHNGICDFYRYQHQQFHSNFARHVNEPEKVLQDVVQVKGVTLPRLLDIAGLKRCDLLLLNCEGAEIYALEALLASEELRGRVGQICCSPHCYHVPVYPPKVWDDLMTRLKELYKVRQGKFKPIPYFLFAPRAEGT